jgi:hypothetical protein
MSKVTIRASAEAPTGREPAEKPLGLQAVRRLLEQLHVRGIVYCHWKSNEHVGPAVEGLTDLDVLVERRQHAELQRILVDAGFKRFTAVPAREYPAVEDYLGFDAATGVLSHLHLHYELTIGQPYLKGYRVPWEGRLLATRTFDARHGIYVADPALELLLLVVRGALKRRLRDTWRRPSEDYRRELVWLRQRVEVSEVCTLAVELLGAEVETPLRGLLADPDASEHLVRFARKARPTLRHYRTYGRLHASMRALSRELHRVAGAVNRRTSGRPVPFKRVSPRGGTIVVFLGSDGSGKSSLVKEMVGWLNVKLDVVPLYFGSGNGPSSLPRLPLQLARRITDAVLRTGVRTSEAALRENRARSALRSIARVPWALSLSLEKRMKLRRMVEARNRGMIVICDRYPQAECPGFNDGPLLPDLSGSRWRFCRAMAAWEARPYAEARLALPDLVVKLVVPADVALGRRPEMSIAEVRRRIEAVAKLTFPESTRVLEVENTRALCQAALVAKRLTWEEL